MNWTPPVFKPIVYIPSTKEKYILSKRVQTFQICAVMKEHDHVRGDVQHWLISLKTGDCESVTIDMQPTHNQPSTVLVGGSKGVLVVSLLSKSVEANVVHNIQITPLETGIMVENVMETLKQSDREKYEFNSQGTGCRNWICGTTTLLTDRRYIDAEAAKRAQADVSRLWPDNIASPMDTGAYYS
jgi:hypothetical protein